MLVFTLINLAGVNWLAESNKATVIWKTAVPLLTIVVLIAVSFHGSNFTAGGGFAPFGAHGVFAALPLGVVFALQGFEQAVQMGGEARNPQRDMPRAVMGAVLIGTLIYLLLEVAFIGALDPANLAGGWANPIGEGDFGPYATIATTLGFGWLAVILYIDAFISPAGTGLIYVGTSARLSYALGHAGFVPKGISKISARGVPWTSVLLAFVVGLICFLPFPSWQSLVGLVTSATVIMYGFAPVTLIALRRSDPDRPRPYRLPAPEIMSPLAFICANLIIYWTDWEAVEQAGARHPGRIRDLRAVLRVQAAGGEASAGPDRPGLDGAVARRAGPDLLPRPVRRHRRAPGLDRPAGRGGVQPRDLLHRGAGGAAPRPGACRVRRGRGGGGGGSRSWPRAERHRGGVRTSPAKP